MEDRMERSLMDSLNECMVYELPEPLAEGEKRIWAIGIALVRKVDCSRNYCVVKNDGYGRPFMVHDFGNTAMVVKYEQVYPVSYLSEEDMPVIRSKKDYLSYLVKHDEDAGCISALLDTKKSDGTPKTDKEKEDDRGIVKALTIIHAVDDVVYFAENARMIENEENEQEEEQKQGGTEEED